MKRGKYSKKGKHKKGKRARRDQDVVRAESDSEEEPEAEVGKNLALFDVRLWGCCFVSKSQTRSSGPRS
eukprot:8593916-Pyramimonas_sp.AAC.1